MFILCKRKVEYIQESSSRLELYSTGVTVHILEPGGFKTQIINFDAFEKEQAIALEQADEDTRKTYAHHLTFCKYI